MLIQISHSVDSGVFGTYIVFASCGILCWVLCCDVLCSVLSHLAFLIKHNDCCILRKNAKGYALFHA